MPRSPDPQILPFVHSLSIVEVGSVLRRVSSFQADSPRPSLNRTEIPSDVIRSMCIAMHSPSHKRPRPACLQILKLHCALVLQLLSQSHMYRLLPRRARAGHTAAVAVADGPWPPDLAEATTKQACQELGCQAWQQCHMHAL